MEKTIEELKFEKAWLCNFLMDVRDRLKRGTLKADMKWEEIGGENFTLMDLIDSTLDNVGAVEALAEDRARSRLDLLKWYSERGREVFPDMKPPKGYMP